LKMFDQKDVYANPVRIYRQIGRIYEPSSDIRCYTQFKKYFSNGELGMIGFQRGINLIFSKKRGG
jgi:hypothetical protein